MSATADGPAKGDAASGHADGRSQPTPGHVVAPCVRVVDECPIIINGLRAMLEPLLPGINILTDRSGLQEPPPQLIFYDPAQQVGPRPRWLSDLLMDPEHIPVVAFSFSPAPHLVSDWLSAGFAYVLDKRASDVEVAQLITSLLDERPSRARAQDAAALRGRATWPGEQFGLSRREAEIMAHITEGVSNADICALTGLTHNTVKSYVRSAYGKLGLSRRPQAVRWGMLHGIHHGWGRADADGRT